jgi:phosphomannomutase
MELPRVWRTLFKSYDVRGTVSDQLDEDAAHAIGLGLANYLGAGPVAVGRDMRLSSAELAVALSQGLNDGGVEVWDLGLCSSDMVTFVTGRYEIAGGVMVTASHNPPQWNGFKCCECGGYPLSGQHGLDQVLDRILTGRLERAHSPAGIVRRDLMGEYVHHLLSFIDVRALRPLKVVVDAGNGMAGQMFPEVARHLPIQVIPLFFELDGRFPNHLASPIEPENQEDCKRKIRETGADLGLLFDGDADRVFVVDEKAEGLSGTILTALIAERMLQRHPGATVLYNVICGRIVPEVIARAGGRGVQTPVGHSLIKAIMRKEAAIFAGEHSGHYFFRDNYCADSGLIAALIVLELVSRQGLPLSEVVAPYENYYASGEINTPVADAAEQQAKIAALLERAAGGRVLTLDGLRVDYPHWWFNVRPSNTEPLLRVNVEADTPELMARQRDELLAFLREGAQGSGLGARSEGGNRNPKP